ncbi:pescadillo-like [Lytechinus variegatus]|uniref:pescadillo-like n=1 Tax=Lytechinus variegatus TaxID=7654 RepID=UPI001BB270CD|nr:pescadillo-like [Lytechinus variegatus]
MGKEKKKFKSGIATSFITRASAVKRLQLNLVNFRRLCILKGVYPVEPKSIKKAGKGQKLHRTYFRFKDIQFLAHEPIVQNFRDHRVFVRKVRKAKAKREWTSLDRLNRNEPKYKLDHIVKERYPTFVDALRDLEDPLTLCSLFSTFRKNAKVKSEVLPLCRRLVVEFMNYVIASRSLKKVFLSIKGIYFQVEIEGQLLTWLIPYNFGYSVPGDVDLKIMSTFTEFYTTLLGFVNFKLFTSLNLHYPPKLSTVVQSTKSEADQVEDDETVDDLIGSFVHDLVKVNQGSSIDDEEDEANQQDQDQEEALIAGGTVDEETVKKAREERDEMKRFKKLFEGCKFFLSREVPREAITFVIRCFGGQVSWDKTMFVGAPYEVSDETITHQIVDRPQQEKQYLSRYYIQPQWVFDCVNARRLVPLEDYFPGVSLPPHLSPFVEEKEGSYRPPERLAGQNETKNTESDDDEDNEEEVGEEEEEIIGESENEEDLEEGQSSDEEDDDETSIEEAEKKRLQQLSKQAQKQKTKLSVAAGEVEKTNPIWEAEKLARMERGLQEMMIPKKRKRLYDRLMKKKKEQAKEVRKLKEKRLKYDQEQKAKKKMTGTSG